MGGGEKKKKFLITTIQLMNMYNYVNIYINSKEEIYWIGNKIELNNEKKKVLIIN